MRKMMLSAGLCFCMCFSLLAQPYAYAPRFHLSFVDYTYDFFKQYASMPIKALFFSERPYKYLKENYPEYYNSHAVAFVRGTSLMGLSSPSSSLFENMKLSAFFLGSNIVNFWNIEEGPGQIERDIVAEMDDKIDDASIEARSKFLEGTEQAQSDAALKIAQTINSLLENYPDIDPKDEKLAKRFKASWEDINNTAIFVGQDFIDLVISKLKRIGQESAGDLEKHREIIELWLYLKTEK